MRAHLITAITLLAATASSPGQLTLVPRGAVWKYSASGVAETNWTQSGFDDQAWYSGRAQLGYGEGDEQTLLFDDWGDAPNTLYFRRTFTVTNLAALSVVTMRVVADDGAIAYLNGAEVVRRNMPAGTASATTPAASNLETNENRFAQFGMFPSRLRAGTNILAVETHQHPAGLQDGSFDLELLAHTNPIQPPSIMILSPTNDAVIHAGDVFVEIAWSDPASHVTRVEFYTNGVLLGQAADEPFSLRWPSPATGHYRVIARAYNNFSRAGDSPLVHVQVGTEAVPQLSRGPYLQCGSPTNVIVRWRTDWFTDSVVRYGTNAAGPDHGLTNASGALDHEMNVTGLHPDAAYFYSVGSSSMTLAGGNECRFRAAPTNARPVRVWVIGDSGTADQNQASVRDAYAAAVGTNATDLWLMLGDNAYGSGLDHEYQAAVFNVYPQLLRQTVLWPTLGNHDAGDDPTDYGNHGTDYLNIFTLPKNGEAGGVASGSELYYSFDYANVHVVCLDSFLSDRSTNGSMLTWLRHDLAATDKDWIIAYWHHPPYSWCDHNSDTDYFQTEMRERALPLLEEHGVDLVFSGHSHAYERSFLLDGHYGPSWTLQPSMVLDAGFGRADDAEPYRKPSGGLGGHRGAVYTVCGCSGAGGGGEDFPRHPAMAVNHGGYGSMVIEIDGLRLDARFLRPSGAVDDYFTIDKSAPVAIRPQMEITRGTNGAMISWPTSHPAFALQSAGALPATNWEAVTEPAQTRGRRNFVTVATNGAGRFFRLRAGP